MHDKSPIRRLGVPEFVRTFQDLLLPTAEFSQFEQYLIEGTYEMVVIGHYETDQLKSINTTARVAYRILQNGASRSFEAIVQPYLFNIERITKSLNRSRKAQKEALEETIADQRILKLLSFYKTLYEGLMPVLFAPIIASMATAAGRKTAKKYTIDREGKASLSHLERIQYEWSSQKKQLALGLNNHLRNSYAHECYRLLDGGRVELWDIHPRTGNYSWGPVTYTEDVVWEECEALWRNALGIIYGWALFSINNRKIIEQGKFDATMPIAHDPLRSDEIKYLVESVVSGRGFDLISCQFQNDQLIFKLRCQLKGVDQDSEIFTKSGNSVRRFVIKMKYHECSIIEQLLGSFQILRYQVGQEFEFMATVYGIECANIGEIRGHTRLFKQYDGKHLPPIDDFRKELTIDTVGKATTWMVEESLPQEI